ERGGLGEPGGIPERTNLALGLITGAGTAIEAVERGRVQEQSLHHQAASPFADSRPFASTERVRPRQQTFLPQRLAISTTNDSESRSGTIQAATGSRANRRSTVRTRTTRAMAASASTATALQAKPPSRTPIKASGRGYVTADAA